METRKRGMRLVPLPYLQVKRSAYIMGEHSASAAALKEYERREHSGESVRFYFDVHSGAIVVGPHSPARDAGTQKID